MQVAEATPVVDQPAAIPKTLSINAPTSGDLMLTADKHLEDARAVVIDSTEMLEIANDELSAIKGKWKALDEQRKSLVDPLNLVVKGINDLFRAPLARLTEGETIVKQAILAFSQEQERKAEEERAKAQKLADEERQRAQAEADAALQRAQAAAAAGDTAAAEQATAEAHAAQTTAALVVAAPVSAPAVRVAGGASIRKTWKARLPQTDAEKLALLKFIVANPEYLNLVEPSQKECNKIASALKQHMKIDGLTAYADSTVAASAK